MWYPARRHSFKADIDPEAGKLLASVSPAVGHLLEQYLDMIGGYAREAGVKVTHTEVDAYHDPEDNTDQLLVAQCVKLPSEKVMEYWDHVGAVVEDWAKGLGAEESDLVSEWIALEVRPDVANYQIAPDKAKDRDWAQNWATAERIVSRVMPQLESI